MSRFTPRFYIAATVVLAILLFGFLGPLLTDRTPSDVVGGLYDRPSAAAWLGTDNLGHDVLATLVYGTRASLVVGLLAGLLATLVGVVVGVTAGYRGGWVEEGLMGITNVVLAIPAIVVLILVSVALQSRTAITLALVIGITTWPWTARSVRAQAASLRHREHVDIARLSGARPLGVVLFDVLPYMFSYICMAFVLQLANAILNEAALSLLGLGPTSGTSLGVMLHWSLAWEAIRTGAWWAFVPPTALLTLIAFALLMLQSSLDETFNPRLRNRRRRPRLPALAAATSRERS